MKSYRKIWLIYTVYSHKFIDYYDGKKYPTIHSCSGSLILKKHPVQISFTWEKYDLVTNDLFRFYYFCCNGVNISGWIEKKREVISHLLVSSDIGFSAEIDVNLRVYVSSA